jgi:hypothetical protein
MVWAHTELVSTKERTLSTTKREDHSKFSVKQA